MNRISPAQQNLMAMQFNSGAFGGQIPGVLTQQQQPTSGGFLSDLAGAKGGPLTSFLGNVADPFMDLLEGGRRLIKGGGKDYKPMFMSQEEYDKYGKNFAGEALKTGLGLGSFFIPGGSLAKAGLAGAMSGISNVDDITNIGDVLKGAGLGAFGGGATYGALKGVSKLLSKGANKTGQQLIGTGKTIGELQKGIQSSSSNATKQLLPGLEDMFNTGNFAGAQKIINSIDDPAYKATQQNLLNMLSKRASSTPVKTGIAGALDDLASKTEIKGFKNKFGVTPTPTQGGNSLFAKMKEIGLDPKKASNLDDLAAKANKMATTTGKQLQRGYRQMAKKGVVVDIQDVLQNYVDDIEKTANPTIRKAKEQALEEVMGTIDSVTPGQVDPFKLDPLKFKRVTSEIGKVGNFDPRVTPVGEARKLGHVNDLYFKLRDRLTETAKKSGFNDVANLNKAFSTASRTKVYANYAATKQSGKSPLSLIDYMMGGAGLAASGGNPLGAAAMVGISKAAQSPTSHFLTANLLRKASNVASKLPNIAMSPQVMNALERSAGRVGGTMATSPQPAMASEMPMQGEVMGMSTPNDINSFIMQNGYNAEDFNNPSAQQALFEQFGGQVSPQNAFSAADQMGRHELFQPEGMGGRYEQPKMNPINELALNLYSTGASPDEVVKLLQMAGIDTSSISGGGMGGGKQLPPTTLMKISDAQNALDAISGLEGLLQEGSGKFNPITGILAEKNPFDTKGQAMNAQLRTARQKIGKFLEGGVLRREDEIKYKEMLPGLTDTPQVAAAKIMQVKAMLENEYGNLMNQLQSGGYDPSYGGAGMASTPDEEMYSLAGLY